MALLDDILRWTETKLTPWQRDAARRLFQKPEGLSEDDYSGLYSMLKAAHGVVVSQPHTPEPLAAAHLPSLGTTGSPVVLKALMQPKNVNRIPTDQKLLFSPAGLTVVYGGNGGGKSGYSRELSRLYRQAR